MKKLVCLMLLIIPLTINSQTKEIRNFIFGHSLIDHRPPINPTPSDETTVPHWVFLLAEAAGHSFAAGGQYGFLPQHQNTPPISQWGYDIVPGVWDSDFESFDQANLTTITITAGNFIQYQPPSEDYYGQEGVSPISATEMIVDFVGEKDIFIYDNWPDMAGFIAGEGFPPSQDEFENYNQYTVGEFHDWWIAYHDAMMSSRPSSDIKMIPVGPVIVEVYNEYLANIDINEMYEDNAPHGRPNLYFLAGLTTYMALFEETAPLDFTVPSLISPLIRDNYEAIVNQIWNYLLEFKTEDGESRVFKATTSSTKEYNYHSLKVFPNPTTRVVHVKSDHRLHNVTIRDITGKTILFHKVNDSCIKIHLPNDLSGFYYIEARSEENQLETQTLMVLPSF